MLNCKIKLLKDFALAHKGETVTFIDGKSHYADGLSGADNYTTIDDFRHRNRHAEFEVIEWEGKSLKSENHPAFAEKLPRICYVLGGEKTPLKINEEFAVTNRAATYRIAEDGTFQYRNNDMEFFAFCKTDTIYALINDTQHIIRRPQFSEDEKALMRLCAGSAYYQWYRDDDGTLHVKEYDEMYGPEINCVSMKGITKQFTRQNPFDAAAYLESEAGK